MPFRYYTISLVAILSFLVVVDCELYRHWGFRLDSTPLLYLKNPAEVFGSANKARLVLQLAIFLVLLSFSIFIYNKLINKQIQRITKGNFGNTVVLIFMLAILILPIRGSFGIAPINVGFVYFSNNSAFANHAAVNVAWNVAYSLSKSKKLKPIHFYPENEAQNTVNELLATKTATNDSLLKTKQPNILLIIMESLTAKYIEALGGEKNVTPQFNKLCDEGILFTNFYANGDRTEKAIVALLSGYPTLPTFSPIKNPAKTQSMPFITKNLKQFGYSTSFVCGFDINFANFNSYLQTAAFDKIINIENFEKQQITGKWGVQDHLVFSRLATEILSQKKLWFTVFMSLSSHEPFDIPTQQKFKGSDEESMFKSSIYYADQSLGNFIEQAKKQSWWNETLIIITADHGHRYPRNSAIFESEKFHIPLLFLGGAVAKNNLKNSNFASQKDLANTILNLLEIENAGEYIFSTDFLNSNNQQFAFYCFNNGFGYLSENSKFIFDITGSKIIETANCNNTCETTAKSFMQILSYDFITKR